MRSNREFRRDIQPGPEPGWTELPGEAHSGGWLIVSVFFHLSIVLYVMDVYQFVAVWLIWWNEPAPS